MSPASLRSGARARIYAWSALAVVLAVVLAIGATRPGAASSSSQRASAIDSALRCPSCEDVSVAASSAPAAVAIRGIVAQRVGEGQSTAEIESFLESRYGVGILLRPPTSGLSGAVWVVPLVVVGTGLAGLGVFFWRRRRVEPSVVPEEDRALVDAVLARSRAGVVDP